jgi:hypothetical protein
MPTPFAENLGKLGVGVENRDVKLGVIPASRNLLEAPQSSKANQAYIDVSRGSRIEVRSTCLCPPGSPPHDFCVGSS